MVSLNCISFSGFGVLNISNPSKKSIIFSCLGFLDKMDNSWPKKVSHVNGSFFLGGIKILFVVSIMLFIFVFYFNFISAFLIVRDSSK